MPRSKTVYRRPGPRVSWSLDIPTKLVQEKPSENVTFRSGFEDQLRLMDNAEDHEEDRYYLYLPRNLSYCHLCADAVKQHVQTKVKHLTSKLLELGINSTQETAAQKSFWLPRGSIQKINTKLKDGTLTSSTSSIESEDSSLSSQFSNESLQKESRKVPSSELPSILRKSKRAKSFPPAKKYSGKKVVRFADSLGLELETVRHLMVSDRPPFVPSKAFADLHHVVNSLELEADFQNPSTWVDFDFQLRRHCVRLHSVRPTYTTVYGLITVLNLTFHKKVSVRYTTNGWTTYNDVYASYVPPSDDEDPHPDRDNFSFNIFTSASDFYGMRELKLSFAICYRTEDGKEYWDNNEGLNYSLTGFYKPITLSAQFKHTWVHFL